ncbi:MAG: hypothetical protein IVW54_05485 [Candidatus Binataceae bacterium]|nr:hypothetical protein [Candidatus Binataceae bacterium]
MNSIFNTIRNRRRAIVALIAIAITLACPFSASARSHLSLSVSGDVLISGGITNNGSPTATAEFFSVSSNEFFATGRMHIARSGLQSQTVGVTPETTVPQTFIFGGSKARVRAIGLTLQQASANAIVIERYDSSKGVFDRYNAHMALPRTLFASVPFPGDFSVTDLDGHILVVGGMAKGGITALGEAIDPTNIEDITGNMNVPRMFATGTLLNDGTVLVTGGITDSSGDVTDTAELFDPSTFNYTELSSTMTVPRAGHTATLLDNGTVLIAGGLTGTGGTLNGLKSAEIYNPISQTFSAVGNLSDDRSFQTASLLGDGTVLIAGGANGDANVVTSKSFKITLVSGGPVNNAEIYNPSSQSFVCAGGSSGTPCPPIMNAGRLFDTATTVADGVLFAGGFGLSNKGTLAAQNTAELYANGQFVPVGNMIEARALQSACVLP